MTTEEFKAIYGMLEQILKELQSIGEKLETLDYNRWEIYRNEMNRTYKS